MKPIPSDPFAFQARVFGAFCDDLFDIAAGKSRTCGRTNALRSINSTRGSEHANNVPDSNQ